MSAALFEIKTEKNRGTDKSGILDATVNAFEDLDRRGLLDPTQKLRRVILEQSASMLDDQFAAGRLSVALSNTLKLVLEELRNLPVTDSEADDMDALDMTLEALTRQALEVPGGAQ